MWKFLRKMCGTTNITVNNYYCCKQRVSLILLATNILNSSKLHVMALNLTTAQKVAGVFGLVDQETQAPVTGTFTGNTVASDNTGVATATVEPDGSILVTAVAAGTCNISGSATANFTDSNGQSQTQTLSIVPIVCTISLAQADNVTLVLNFGSPVSK
jgi:hypothetical protein